MVGAGPVGSVLALALARRGARVILLEKARFPRDKPCGEGLMPAGLAVLEELGVDLPPNEFPRVRGVRYRLPDGRSVLGAFRGADGDALLGAGVRRVRLDPLLLAAATAARGVDFRTGVAASGITEAGDGVRVATSAGELQVAHLVAADGLGSSLRQHLGWSGRVGGARRGLVGHLRTDRHRIDEIIVSLLPGRETYVAPTAVDEVLAVVLYTRPREGDDGAQTELYRTALAAAHPELGTELTGPLLSAGPFDLSVARVASKRVFLAGDAAGFIDPLTGDGMTAGLCAANELARLLVDEPDRAAEAYRGWHRRQLRRRRVVTGLALALSRSPWLARRAMSGVARRPSALEAVMRVNAGSQALSSVSPRAWLALAGI